MTEKGRTTVYINRDQAARVKDELGIDTSTLLSHSLDLIESSGFDDIAVTMRVKIIDDSIAKIDEELLDIDKRKFNLVKQRGEFETLRDRTLKRYEEVKYTVKLQEYMYQLNTIIISCRYDPAAIRMAVKEVQVAGRTINLEEKIRELNPLWKLETHIEQFKKERLRYG